MYETQVDKGVLSSMIATICRSFNATWQSTGSHTKLQTGLCRSEDTIFDQPYITIVKCARGHKRGMAVPVLGIGDGTAKTMHGIEVAAASGGM